MTREIRITLIDGTGGGVPARIGNTRLVVERGEIRAADGSILIEQEVRAERRAVVITIRRGFEIADGFVQPVFLPEMQR